MYRGILGLIVFLGVVGGAVYGIFRLLGGRARPGAHIDTSVGVRRVLVYAGLFVAVVVAAIGAGTLLGEMLGPGDGDRSAGVARGLSLFIVAMPAAVLLDRFVRRTHDGEPRERGSLAWAFYLNAMLATSLVVTMVSAVQVVNDAVDGWTGTSLATAIAWGTVWGYHWFGLLGRFGVRAGLHLATGSLAGMVAMAVGGRIAIARPLEESYRALFDDRITSRGIGDDVTVAIAAAVIGAVVWWWHWLARYLTAERDTLWHAYVIVPGVLAGSLAAVGSLVWMLAGVLVWILGDVSDVAVDYFDFASTTTAVLVVGAALWWYHRSVLRSGGVAERIEPIRVYDYVMAAVGTLAAAGGATAVIASLVDAATRGSAAVSTSEPINVLIVGLTLVVTGSVLWWTFWHRIDRIAASDPEERISPSRRVFLFGIFGAGGLAAFISLIVLLYGILDPLFAGEFDRGALREVRVPLALVVTVGALAWFHFRVWRSDRAIAETFEVTRKVDVILVTADPDLGPRLRSLIHGRVEVWHRLGDGGAPADPDAIAEMVRATGEEHVLVVTGREGPLVVPFED
jgi:hypothetical protein